MSYQSDDHHTWARGVSRRNLADIWQSGKVAVGAWCMIGDSLTAEALATVGFDWLCIDMQHGCMDYSTMIEMVRAIDIVGTPAVVRVPWNEPGVIGRALDAGAAGIIIPMVQSADEARAAVDACLYPSQGRRSFGPVRVGLRDGSSYFDNANGRTLVIPMIETAQAVEQVEDIAAVPGVGALFLGTIDLSISLGLPPRDNDGVGVFDRAIGRTVHAAQARGIGMAMLSSPDQYERRVTQGFNMISVTTDVLRLKDAATQDFAKVRALP